MANMLPKFSTVTLSNGIMNYEIYMTAAILTKMNEDQALAASLLEAATNMFPLEDDSKTKTLSLVESAIILSQFGLMGDIEDKARNPEGMSIASSFSDEPRPSTSTYDSQKPSSSTSKGPGKKGVKRTLTGIAKENTDPNQLESLSQDCRGVLFNRARTLLLIDLYRDRKEKFNSSFYRKKTLWGEIKDQLNERSGSSFSIEQVEGRWKTLVAAFKRHKNDQNSTGRDRKDFEFEDQMEDILGNRHDVLPVCVIASGLSNQSSHEPQPSTSRRVDTVPGPSSLALDSTPKKSTRSSGVQNSVLEFLKTYTEQQKRDQEARAAEARKAHAEKMEVFKMMLQFMKKE